MKTLALCILSAGLMLGQYTFPPASGGGAGTPGAAGAPGQSVSLAGAWSSGTTYSALQVVTYNGSSYYALTGSTNVTPGTDGTKWQLAAQAGSAGSNGSNGVSPTHLGAWSSGTAYVPLNVVTYNGSSYWAVANSTNVTPGTNGAVWVLAAAAGNNGSNGTNGTNGSNGSPGSNGVSPTLLGPWSAGTAYTVLSVVTYGGGSWWATAPSTGVTPGTNSSDWVQVAAPGTAGSNGTNGISPTHLGPWAVGTAYVPLNVVTYSGSSYWAVAGSTGVTPGTNSSIWVLAAQGGTNGTNGTNGLPGSAGASYPATSASSVTIATGSATFTTQSGLAYVAGASRARVAYTTTPTDYVEGVVSSYSGTTLVINVDTVGGSGTFTNWNISLIGNPGSGGAGAVQVAQDLGGTNAAPTVVGIQGHAVNSTAPGTQGQVYAWDTPSSSWKLSSNYLYTDNSGNFTTSGTGTMYALTLSGPQVFNGFNFGDANSNLIYKYPSTTGTIVNFPLLGNSASNNPVTIGEDPSSTGTGGVNILTKNASAVAGPLTLNGAYFPYAFGSNTGTISGQTTAQFWDSTHTYSATLQVPTALTANYNINFPYSTGAAVSVPNLNAGNVWAGGVQNFTAAVTYPYQLGLIASLPTTCTASEMYFASDVSLAGSGQQLNGCWGSNSFGIYPMWFQTFSALGDQPIPNANFGIVVQHSPIVAGHYYWSNRPTSTSPVNSVWEPGVPLSDVTLNGTCVVATQYLGEDGNCHTPGFQMQGNGVGSTLTYNTTTYVSVGASVAMSTVASTHYIMMANAGTINTLFLQTVTANGTSAFTCTMQKLTAGTVTAQTMAISMAASDAAQIYYDTTHPFTVAARDVIYLSCVNSGGTVASAAIGAVSIGFVNN